MTLLYASRFEVAIGALAQYDEWFVSHAADLSAAGFLRVHGYRSSVASHALSNLYELPSLDVFGDAYYEAGRRDVAGRAVRATLSPAELGVFAPIASAGEAGAELLGSAGLAVLDVDDPSGELRRWSADGGLAALANGRSATMYEAIDAPVAAAPAGRLRIVIACASPDDAFVISDKAAAELARHDPAPVSLPAVDVLTHRVSYPAAIAS